MRQEEFKMERTGLVEIGQVIPIIIHLVRHLPCLQISLWVTALSPKRER